MKTTRILWMLLSLSASAQNNGLPVSGPNKPGVGNTPEAVKISEDAGRKPNASSSVTFSRTYNNTPETWTWRVNISDFAIPNRLTDLGQPSANFSEGLRVTNTQWQLGWPSDDDSLQSFLAKQDASITIHTLITNKPSNITSRYNAMDNGNCSAVLSNQCMQSLIQSASVGSRFTFTGLQGCESTLDVRGNGQESGTTTDYNPADMDSNDSDEFRLQRGDTFFYSTSQSHVASNSTGFRQSEAALQVFVMSFEYGNGARGDTSGPIVLCQIVDKNAAPNMESTAVHWGQSMLMLSTAAILSTLAIIW